MSNKWKIYKRLSDQTLFDFFDKKYPEMILCELDMQPIIHDHIKVDGQSYIICVLSFEERCALVHHIELDEDHDTYETDNAVCPHCGYEDIDCFEWSANEDEQECRRCSLKFKYSREIVVTYTTEKIGPSFKKLLAEVNTNG
jgi:hypothetical protein